MTERLFILGQLSSTEDWNCVVFFSSGPGWDRINVSSSRSEAVILCQKEVSGSVSSKVRAGQKNKKLERVKLHKTSAALEVNSKSLLLEKGPQLPACILMKNKRLTSLTFSHHAVQNRHSLPSCPACRFTLWFRRKRRFLVLRQGSRRV